MTGDLQRGLTHLTTSAPLDPLRPPSSIVPHSLRCVAPAPRPTRTDTRLRPSPRSTTPRSRRSGTPIISSAACRNSSRSPCASLLNTQATGPRRLSWRGRDVARRPHPRRGCGSREPAEPVHGLGQRHVDGDRQVEQAAGRGRAPPCRCRGRRWRGSPRRPARRPRPRSARSVPTLPGSRSSCRITTSSAGPASTSGKPTSIARATPTMPCGVMVSDSAAIASSVSRGAPARRRLGPPPPGARTGSIVWRPTNSSVSAPAPSASRTAAGPSTRNSPRERRTWRRVKPAGGRRPGRTVPSAADRRPGAASAKLAGSGCRRRCGAAGSAAFATPTSAAKAAGSVTARSARTLRSTSTPAAFRPWMNRL